MNAAEVLADEQLIEALRTGRTVDAGPLGDRLAEWRDAARLGEPLQGATVSASSAAATASAPAVRCEGLDSARAGGSGDLSASTLPTITAAGPDATDRLGGGTNGPGWVAARDRAVRAAADHAAEIHKAALARQHAANVAACRNLINTLLCERCEKSIPAGDCPCRTWRPEPKATR